MGKGNRMIILSSDDDDDDDGSSLGSSRTGSRSKSRSSCCGTTNPRAAKRARLSVSRASKGSSHVDEIRLSFEDFDEALSGFKVSSGSERGQSKDLWVNKYRPRTVEELAVHKKKVEEVKMWFQEWLNFSKVLFTLDEAEIKNRVLLVTGQAGVGKSATIQAIAFSLGVPVSEWNAPIPTVWLEHMHNSSAGLQYTSKLDEFENFVERTRKYGLIPSSGPGGSKSPIVLLIDDLPLTNGRHAFERLRNCLVLLVRSTQIPTVVLITEYEKMDFADQTAQNMEELQSSLEKEGACKVAFNPITKNSIKRSLQRICREEHCNVTAEEIDQIASASGGDIRNAITSLQLISLKAEQKHIKKNSLRSICSSTYMTVEEKKLNALDGGISSSFGRDETLSLFHALGKFLHNKRETDNVIVPGGGAFLVHDEFARLPMKMDAPEKVLYQAHGQARPVIDFLHENVLDFLSDEAMDDAWSVSSYLADADLLLASFRGMFARHNETENVLQSAGASVAVRGVLYGNSHPLPSRWHAIRRPNLWQVEQSSTRNRKEIMREKSMYYNGARASEVSVIATEYTPTLKWVGFRADQNSSVGSEEAEYKESERIWDEEESEVSEDEIEDW